jgi:hypothetical protein
MSSPFITRADDLDVGMFITATNNDTGLYGSVMEIKAIELPFIAVRLHVNGGGQYYNEPWVFSVDTRVIDVKKLSTEYVNVMINGNTPKKTDQRRSAPAQQASDFERGMQAAEERESGEGGVQQAEAPRQSEGITYMTYNDLFNMFHGGSRRPAAPRKPPVKKPIKGKKNNDKRNKGR